MQLTVEQSAYLAGVIDGEGSIRLARVRVRQTPTYDFFVGITNTKREWLEALQGWIGGKIYQIGGKHAERNRRPCFDLRLRATEAKSLLSAIQPYLMIKKTHVPLMFRYFDLAAERRTSNLPGEASDPEVVRQLDALYEQFKAMNLRGVYQSTTPRGPAPMRQTCTLDGCVRRHHARGYCKVHYKQHVERGGHSLHQKLCIVCGQEFLAKRSDALACSYVCSRDQYYKTHREQVLSRRAAKRKVAAL